MTSASGLGTVAGCRRSGRDVHRSGSGAAGLIRCPWPTGRSTRKTALAGVLAWVVAVDVLGLQQAFLAPWAAVLVVHATVYRTVSRAGQQIVATFLGVLLAWASGGLFGIGPLGMGVMLAAAFLLGRHRWLTEESTTVATTGIVVLATNAIGQSHLLTGRLLDTSVGVVVGLAVNLVVWPPLRDRAAWTHVRHLPHEPRRCARGDGRRAGSRAVLLRRRRLDAALPRARREHRPLLGPAEAGAGEQPAQPSSQQAGRARRDGPLAAPARAGGGRGHQPGAHGRDQRRPGPCLARLLPLRVAPPADHHRRGDRRR